MVVVVMTFHPALQYEVLPKDNNMIKHVSIPVLSG